MLRNFQSSSEINYRDSADSFQLDGILPVYKPKDWTSNDVVLKIKSIISNEVREKTNQKFKIKVGHGGTLDPMATGVLVIGLVKGCKGLESFLKGSKGYLALAVMGEATDTLDSTGKVVAKASTEHVTQVMMEGVLPQFRGDILQVPPMYSALKRDGKKLYELAREGIEVEREARPVHISALELLGQDPFSSPSRPLLLPEFGLSVECGGGTYIRTLIADIAERCQSVAHMTALERTKQGPFTLQDCLKKDSWTLDNIQKALIEIKP